MTEDYYKTQLKKAKLTNKQINVIMKKVSEYEDSNEIFYEILGELHANVDYDNIIQDLDNTNFGANKWNTSLYQKYRNMRAKKDAYQSSPIQIREGEIECPKCHKKKTVIAELQTRSCDEGFTYAIHCYNEGCGYVKIKNNF